MTPFERGLYSHLRFVVRGLGIDMDAETAKRLAHSVNAFIEQQGQAVVNRKAGLLAWAWAEEAITEPSIAPQPAVLLEVEDRLAGLREELGDRPVRCNFYDCPYHPAVNPDDIANLMLKDLLHDPAQLSPR